MTPIVALSNAGMVKRIEPANSLCGQFAPPGPDAGGALLRKSDLEANSALVMANKWTYGPPDFERHDPPITTGAEWVMSGRLERRAGPHGHRVFRCPCAALAQLVRALDCGSRGPRFDPERWYHFPRRSRFETRADFGEMQRAGVSGLQSPRS